MALEVVVSIKGRRLTGRAGLKLTLQVLLAATVLATVGLLAIVSRVRETDRDAARLNWPAQKSRASVRPHLKFLSGGNVG